MARGTADTYRLSKVIVKQHIHLQDFRRFQRIVQTPYFFLYFMEHLLKYNIPKGGIDFNPLVNSVRSNRKLQYQIQYKHAGQTDG